MKNMMKEYLGDKYSSNHLRNFCLYWIKALACRDAYPSSDEWRRENDLDCLYLDGDLRADTLMSAWTPIKWVADHLNRDIGITFYKTSKDSKDPCHDMKLLAEHGDLYLPPEHELVRLLNRFLELAELRCNFILLPSRGMNPERYRCRVGATTLWLCDEVPATLAHLFDPESLGKYFVDKDDVVRWVKREHLEMGFEDNRIDLCRVRPLVEGRDPYTPLWLKKENEIAQALRYMIDFLEKRMEALTDAEAFVGDPEKATETAVCRMSLPDDPGCVYVRSDASGQNRVAGSIGSVFEKLAEEGLTEDIDRIEICVRGDITDAEASQIGGCIDRLRKWYDGGRENPYRYRYEKDQTMRGICSASAILHRKSEGSISAPVKEIPTDDGDLARPEGLTSDVLWEMYRLFRSARIPYLWVDTSPRNRGRYRLYIIKDVTFGHGETEYGVGNMGIELPWNRREWIDLKLVYADGKGNAISTHRICVDAISGCNDTMEEILEKHHMRLPERIGQ